MGERSAPNLKRYLPHVTAVTAAVIVLPFLLVSPLANFGLWVSLLVAGPLAMAISLGLSSVGSAWWKKRPDAHDLVFSDLILWGWVRRLRTERRLSRAVELLATQSAVPRERQLEYFEGLASALEARDPYTHGHTRRVTRHSVAIAERMGLPREQVAKVRTAAAIHDIGKLNTPREVLNKPGRLSDEEFAIIKRHPVDGAELAEHLGDPEITAMVLHHHERLDGTGYPAGLAGEEIPLGARIISVADTFDAITSKRPYRGASSHKKGMAILTKEAGTQLDPDAVRAFSSHYSGRRGIALGSLITSAPQRLLPWSVGSTPVAKGLAALALAGVLGGSAGALTGSGPSHRSAAARDVAQRARLNVAGPVRSSPSGRTGSQPTSAPALQRTGQTAGHAGHKSRSGQPVGRPGHGTARAGGTASSGGSGSSASSGTGTPTDSGAGGTHHSSGGGGSTAPGGGSSSPPSGSSSPTVTTPPVKVSTPSVTTPSVSVSTPAGTVTTPTVTTPSVTVSTPSVSVKPPSLP